MWEDAELQSSPVPAGVPPRSVPAVPALPEPGEDVSMQSDAADQAPRAGLL